LEVVVEGMFWETGGGLETGSFLAATAATMAVKPMVRRVWSVTVRKFWCISRNLFHSL